MVIFLHRKEVVELRRSLSGLGVNKLPILKMSDFDDPPHLHPIFERNLKKLRCNGQNRPFSSILRALPTFW